MIRNSILVELRWVFVALSLNGLCIYAAFLHLAGVLCCLSLELFFLSSDFARNSAVGYVFKAFYFVGAFIC